MPFVKRIPYKETPISKIPANSTICHWMALLSSKVKEKNCRNTVIITKTAISISDAVFKKNLIFF